MYERIIQAVLNHPWAIMPEKLAAIEAFLAVRGAGRMVSAEEIAAATNGRRSGELQQAATVAVIPIYGTIHQHAGLMADYSGGVSVDGIRKALRQAMADAQVSSVVFDIDSPGGSVYGVDELAAEILSYRNTKPMVAIANSLAASAAYYLASAANEVWVTPSGCVGSIGVYMAHVDASKYYENEGLKVSYIYAGRYKTEGNDAEPLSTEARDHFQADVDEYYRMFVTAVARGRGVATEVVRNDFGEGRTVLARAAKAVGMVDGIGTFDDALARADKLARLAQRERGQQQADAIRLGVQF